MSKIYVWSMKSSLHTNYRFRGTMKKLAIQIKREFAEVMNLKKIKPLTMNKQTVWVESDPINKDSILLTGGEEMKHVNKLDSVYVLTEQEMNNVKREAHIKSYQMHRNDGLDQLIEWIEEKYKVYAIPAFKEILTKANEILNNQ